MKMPMLLTVLCLLVFSAPGMTQNKAQAPGNPAHDTVIDGRWEARPTPEKEPIAVFEFKCEKGVVSGVAIQNGQSMEIKNGSLEGSNLKFETMQPSSGDSPMKITWTGAIASNSQSIVLTSTAEPIKGDSDQHGKPQQFELRRAK